MKIPRPGKSLSDDTGSDDLPAAFDELPIRLVRKHDLRQSGHNQRIDDSQQDRGRDGHQDCGNQILLHDKFPYASPILVINMSMSLMPINGMMMPPMP